MTIPASMNPQMMKLAPEAQEAVTYDYGRRAKSFPVALVLAIFGFHYLYFGKVGMWLLYFVTCGGMMIWWFIDLFRVHGMVERNNEDLARSLMVQYKNLA